MTGMKEKGKWLIALALCLSCFALCASLIAAPTFAEEAAPKAFEAVTGYKNVYERLSATGVSKSPKEFFYASGADPAKVYNAELTLTAAGKYTIGIDGYAVAPVTRDFPIKANGTLDTTNPTPPAPPPADPPVLKQIKISAAVDYKNIYELCDKDGDSLTPNEYVYACSENPNDEFSLPALKKGDTYYLRLKDDIYVAVAADGALDCGDVIKKLGAAGEEVLFPLPAPVYKYKAAEDCKNIYEVLDKDGKSKSPKEYIYSTKAPEDGKAPPAQSQEALVKGDAFYVCFLDGSGIFLAVNDDGTLNFGKALWWGLDGNFGTADDLVTSVKEDGGYYYWQQGQGVWQMIRGIFNPNFTTTAAPTSSSTAAPVYRYRAVENQTNLYELLNTDGSARSPREYIYSETAPVNGSAPPASARTALLRGDYFYVPLVEDSGIFLAVNTDGTFNYSNAVWWGLDRRFGTSDDFDTSVRIEDNGMYSWLQANGLWQLIQGFIHPEHTSTTENPLLTTQDPGGPPKTGKEGLNPGVAVCMALLLMGCLYCGFQAFRRRAVRVR